MVLPKFVHVGPQRCGTTYLYDSLVPLGCVPRQVKEIQFFDRHFDLGLEWYASHFDECAAVPVAGEICPSYFDSVDAVERIRESLPAVRVLCTLRDPMTRVPSYFKLLRMYGQCPASIERAWEESAELRDCCMYSDRLARWRQVFGDRLLVLWFDDLAVRPAAFLETLCRFAGAPVSAADLHLQRAPESEPIPRFPALSQWTARAGTVLRRRRMYGVLEAARAVVRPLIFGAGRPQRDVPMTAAFQQTIRNYHRDDVKRLSTETHRDLSSWLV